MKDSSLGPETSPYAAELERCVKSPDHTCSDVFVDISTPASLLEGTYTVITRLIPEFSGIERDNLSISQISGGVTNLLYLVSLSTDDGVKRVLIRVFGEKTEYLIDRPRERVLFRWLSERGIVPQYLGGFSNGRLEAYVDSRCLESPEMRLPAMIPIIVKKTVEVHRAEIPSSISSMYGAVGMPTSPPSHPTTSIVSPTLWAKLVRWVPLAKSVRLSEDRACAILRGLLDGGGMSQVEREVAWLKTVVPSELNGHGALFVERAEKAGNHALARAWKFVSDVVFAHNDILANNMLLPTAEERRLRRIGILPAPSASVATAKGVARDGHAGDEVKEEKASAGGGGGGGDGGGGGEGGEENGGEEGIALGKSLLFIDFEYAWFNYRGFDLGNHFCEYAGFDFYPKDYPTTEEKRRYLRNYVDAWSKTEGDGYKPWTEEDIEALIQVVDKFSITSSLFWAIWAIVQAQNSKIDFDFIGYADTRLKFYIHHKKLFFPDHETFAPATTLSEPTKEDM